MAIEKVCIGLAVMSRGGGLRRALTGGLGFWTVVVYPISAAAAGDGIGAGAAGTEYRRQGRA